MKSIKITCVISGILFAFYAAFTQNITEAVVISAVGIALTICGVRGLQEED